MTLTFLITWGGSGIGFGGGSEEMPTWETLEFRLNRIQRQSGSVTVFRRDPPHTGPQSLQVISEGMRYILMLGENTEDDYDVRTYDNGLGARELAGFNGECFPACSIFGDFQIVLKAFREFFETGDVSRDLLK